MELCPGGDLVNYMTEGLGAFDEAQPLGPPPWRGVRGLELN